VVAEIPPSVPIDARRNVVDFLGRYAICWEASDGGGGPLPNKVKKASPGTDIQSLVRSNNELMRSVAPLLKFRHLGWHP